MNKRDSLAILGWLFVGPFSVYYEGIDKHDTVETLQERTEFADAILEYLQSLKLPYTFVRDILSGEYDSVFYHVELGANSEPLPINYNKEELYTSEHDGQIWFDDNGRLGVWCEVDGFVAWLDEYQKVWIVDSQEEIAKQRKEMEEHFKKEWQPIFDKMIKACSKSNDVNTSGTVKIEKFEVPGLDFRRIK